MGEIKTNEHPVSSVSGRFSVNVSGWFGGTGREGASRPSPSQSVCGRVPGWLISGRDNQIPVVSSYKAPQEPEDGAPRSSAFRRVTKLVFDRLQSASEADAFGKGSRAISFIRLTVRIVVFWFAWKALDTLFVIYWLFSALLAILVTIVLMRILRRLFVE
jgi:hypothetical protein